MKNYTPEEVKAARAKAPEPVADFLNSETLINIYVGIFAKLKLNLRQGGLITEVVNATLAGLEPEHAIETNLHQALPELSNEATRELIADINDRIFKEASRRLQQNVLEPKQGWDETELGPRLTPEEIEKNRTREKEEDKHPIGLEELKKMADQERMERRIQEDAEEAAALKIRTTEAPVAQPEVKKEGNSAPLPSVAMERLSGGIAAKPLTVTVQQQTSPLQQIRVENNQKTENTPRPPISVKLPEPQAVKPPIPVVNTPPPYKGVDPYREPVE